MLCNALKDFFNLTRNSCACVMPALHAANDIKRSACCMHAVAPRVAIVLALTTVCTHNSQGKGQALADHERQEKEREDGISVRDAGAYHSPLPSLASVVARSIYRLHTLTLIRRHNFHASLASLALLAYLASPASNDTQERAKEKVEADAKVMKLV